MNNKFIFIVDDDRIIQNLLEYTFQNRHGYEVKVFSTGEECLKNLDLKPKLIVLDHIFTKNDNVLMSGLDALVEIRKTNKEVDIIILSNQTDQAVIDEFFAKGATTYLSKEGYFIDTLIETIEKMISN